MNNSCVLTILLVITVILTSIITSTNKSYQKSKVASINLSDESNIKGIVKDIVIDIAFNILYGVVCVLLTSMMSPSWNLIFIGAIVGPLFGEPLINILTAMLLVAANKILGGNTDDVEKFSKMLKGNNSTPYPTKKEKKKK